MTTTYALKFTWYCGKKKFKKTDAWLRKLLSFDCRRTMQWCLSFFVSSLLLGSYKRNYFFSPPGSDSFRCFFLFLQGISELRRPIAAKFCTLVRTRPYFITPVQNFGGHPQKIFRGQKHAKFGPNSDDFEIWRQISPERMKIFKISQVFDLPRFLPR